MNNRCKGNHSFHGKLYSLSGKMMTEIRNFNGPEFYFPVASMQESGSEFRA
jgi:hypothetical protein